MSDDTPDTNGAAFHWTFSHVAGMTMSDDTPDTNGAAVESLAKEISAAIGSCYVCGYPIGTRQKATKDGDEYRHADCQPAKVETTEPKRGRPPGARTKRARRNHAAELAALQSRVTLAVRVLRRIADADTPAGQQLIAVAIETLEQAE